MSYQFLIVLLTLVAFERSAAVGDKCEKIEKFNWELVGSQKTCYVSSSLSIRTEGVKVDFEGDATVTAICLHLNKNIEFLPIKLSESYPNLVGMYARKCPIEKISKVNFMNLNKLQLLDLGSNKIETIPKSAFNDLVELRWLFLYGNKIKKVNGEAFARLTKLEWVWLHSNVCIDEDFEPVELSTLQREVSAACGFQEEVEVEDTTEQSESREAQLVATIEKQSQQLAEQSKQLFEQSKKIIEQSEQLKKITEENSVTVAENFELKRSNKILKTQNIEQAATIKQLRTSVQQFFILE